MLIGKQNQSAAGLWPEPAVNSQHLSDGGFSLFAYLRLWKLQHACFCYSFNQNPPVIESGLGMLQHQEQQKIFLARVSAGGPCCNMNGPPIAVIARAEPCGSNPRLANLAIHGEYNAYAYALPYLACAVALLAALSHAAMDAGCEGKGAAGSGVKALLEVFGEGKADTGHILSSATATQQHHTQPSGPQSVAVGPDAGASLVSAGSGHAYPDLCLGCGDLDTILE